ncbi:MAG TPA: metallophosphoesterase [Paludibacter sp.]
MKIGFFILALAILLSMNSYVMVRGWHALPPVSVLRPVYLFSMLVLFVAMFAGMIFGSSMPPAVGKAVTFVGYTYMIIFIYLFLSFLLVDIVRLANYAIHFAPAGMSVFRMWAMYITLGSTAVALVIGNIKFNHPEIVTLNLSTEKPLQHKTLKIVAASDIHLGVSIDKKQLQKYVKMINDQHPDIVLLPGDVSDREMKPVIAQHMDEELRSIKAPMGIFAINGNHEHYAETPKATAEYLKKAGITFLCDEVSMVDSSFYIVGRDDRTNHKRKNLAEIVKGLDTTKPIILMDHQPFHLSEAENNGIDLQISGHTHNGQFFPGNLFVKRMFELGHGYLKKGKTHYYVSSGLGLWGPQYRIGTQSELVVINLKY